MLQNKQYKSPKDEAKGGWRKVPRKNVKQKVGPKLNEYNMEFYRQQSHVVAEYLIVWAFNGNIVRVISYFIKQAARRRPLTN